MLLAQIETPLEEAKKLSEELGNTLLLKREDLQAVAHYLFQHLLKHGLK